MFRIQGLGLMCWVLLPLSNSWIISILWCLLIGPLIQTVAGWGQYPTYVFWGRSLGLLGFRAGGLGADGREFFPFIG